MTIELGARYLCRRKHTDDVLDIVVEEISPSGEYFRPSERRNWNLIADYVFMEQLPPPRQPESLKRALDDLET